MKLLRIVFAVLVGMAAAVVVHDASADEIAPALVGEELRQDARRELERLFGALDAGEKRRLAGTYVAFDADASDAFAMAACDDDGDHVIVLSHAMLRLVADVSRAQADASPSKIDDYADVVARAQIAGRRLAPPPPGFFDGDIVASPDDLRREALAFVVARELAVLRAGDLVCPHPTATKEHGDDEWTDGERRAAFATSKRLYPAASSRDDEAIARVLAAGRTTRGALGVLRFFARLEAQRPAAPPSYLAHHPGSAAVSRRIESLEKP